MRPLRRPWQVRAGMIILFIGACLLQTGCFLTRGLWEEDHPGGRQRDRVACRPVVLMRDKNDFYAVLRVETAMKVTARRDVRDGKPQNEWVFRELAQGQRITLRGTAELTPDEEVWKAFVRSEAKVWASLDVDGEFDTWRGRLELSRVRPVHIRPRSPDVPGLPLPADARSRLRVGDRDSWLGRAFAQLESTEFSDSSRRVVRAGRPPARGYPLVIAYQQRGKPLDEDVRGLKQRLLESYRLGEAVTLSDYTLVLGMADRFDETVHPGLWQIGLDELTLRSLERDLRFISLEEIVDPPAGSAMTMLTEWSVPERIDVLVLREMPEHDLPLPARVILTPFAVVGDAVIIITSPVWGPIALLTIASRMSAGPGG